jgi:hypothetical protein
MARRTLGADGKDHVPTMRTPFSRKNQHHDPPADRGPAVVNLQQEIIKMTSAINVFNFDSPFPYVLVFGTALTILSLAGVYITSSLILN